ncbi:hypothetical protein BGZ73_002011 [Actinomortierella ambigua]|nr:hypothetical protein BGZ73_002011 [Actinomortierella ambigua]
MIKYLTRLGEAEPQFQACCDYAKGQLPQATDEVLLQAWESTKNYFIQQTDEELENMQEHGDAYRLAAFFKGGNAIEDTKSLSNAPPPQQQPASEIDGRSSSGSGGSSNSGGRSRTCSLNSTAITKMRSTFEENWNDYSGESWTLKPGLCLDDQLRGFTLGLDYEASLHSFIIQDLNEVMGLCTDPSDMKELLLLVGQGRDSDAWRLKPLESMVLSRYIITSRQYYRSS